MPDKRILLINHYAGSPDMGMAFRPYYLAREWLKMGYRVDIIAADFSHLRIKNPEISHDFQEEVIDGIHYHWVHTSRYQGNGVKRALTMAQFVGKLWLRAGKIARELKPDIVITSSTYPLDTFAGQRIVKIRNGGGVRKLIHEVHDMWPETPVRLGNLPRWHPFVVAMQIGENSAYRHSDYVVSLLPLAEDYMKRHGLADKKFCHIPNGVVEEEWDNPAPIPAEHEALLRQLKADGRFIVGYFGGHALSNDLDTLLDATKLCGKDTAFVLVGNGVEKARLMERAQAENLSHVFFLPPVPKLAVPNLVKWFDCSYMGTMQSPLYQFGLCINKLFDSMMAGKPILCAITTPDDIVSRYGCGVMLPSEQPERVAQAVDKLKSMTPEERLQMGRNGQDAAKQFFTYRQLAKKFAALFDHIRLTEKNDTAFRAARR